METGWVYSCGGSRSQAQPGGRRPPFWAAALLRGVAGTTPDNVEWVRRKGNVMARFHRSSYAIGREMEEKKSNLFDRYGLPVADYACHGGSFPLRVVGAGVIGSVTVSGLPERADHQLAVEALCAELGRPFEHPPPRIASDYSPPDLRRTSARVQASQVVKRGI